MGRGLGIALLVTVALVGSCVIGSGNREGNRVAEKLTDLATVKPAIDKIPRRQSWQEVEIKEADGRSYSLTLWYRDGAIVMRGEPEVDTLVVARAVLAALVHAGHQPARESVNVWVSAMQHVRGETGAALVNWFGNTSYNYNTDQLIYKACGPGSWLGC